MKLLTELEDRMNGHGKRPVYNAGGIRPERAFAQDVMAAHALLQAVGEVRGYYPESAFPESGDSLDCKSASMARNTCNNIEKRAAEILAGWLGEDRNG